MRTVVLGLFDDLDDARKVLAQLAASPLDLDAIEVIRRDLASQTELAHEAGLRPRRGPAAAVAAGALLGATAGAMAGQGPLGALGPLLAMAGGLVGGAALGAALAAISDSLRVPEAHRSEMTEAIVAGATAVVVRTANVPTARAIGDLFRAAGSRALSPLEGVEVADGSPVDAPAPAGHPGVGAAPADAAVPGGDALFAPPWRRGVPQPEAAAPPAPEVAPEPPAAAPAAAAALPGPAASPPGASRGAEPSESQTPARGVRLSELADIIVLDLGARATRALRDAGLDTVGALAARLSDGDDALMAVPGIGPAAARAVREALASAGVPIPPADAATAAPPERAGEPPSPSSGAAGPTTRRAEPAPPPAPPPAPRTAVGDPVDVRDLLRAAIREVRKESE